MAEAFWENIYRFSKCISEQRRALSFFRKMDYHHGELVLKENRSRLDETFGGAAENLKVGQSSLSELIDYVYDEERELTLRADILENAVIPVMESYVQGLAQAGGKQVDEDYAIESASNGFLTLKNTFSGRYLHSHNDPMEEARLQILGVYDPSFREYAVYGCGLGYQVYQLYRISMGSVVIHVFEESGNKIECARRFGVLSWIPEELLRIHINKDPDPFLEMLETGGKGIWMSYPYICSLKKEEERYRMLEAFGSWHSPLIFREEILINFYRNIGADVKIISGSMNLHSLFSALEKEAVVIAAGPSLDEKMELLKSWQGKKTLIAVGTVFGKLLKAGIRPDFVMCLDPQERILKQIEGCEAETIPMILDAAAYWEIAARYRGPKYLVFRETRKEIRDYMRQKGIHEWEYGGTVASLVMDFAVRTGAERIYLAGLDLAFPEGKSHAKGTMDYQTMNLNGLQQIEGAAGGKVYTSSAFQVYLKWTENFIGKHPDIEWYNLSTQGAKIRGTRQFIP